MRTVLILCISGAVAAASGACGSRHGNSVGDDDAGSVPCDGPGCRVNCRAMGLRETTLSGTVFAPNGTLPLYGVNVYVPASDPGPLPDGARCARCTDPLPGNPILSGVSDANGRFSLIGVPPGDNIPLVITTGKWRRQIVVPHVDACAEHPLAPIDTTLPRDRTEGDLPRIAITTGLADSLECLVRKLGVADSEITTDQGGGHVQLYVGSTGKDRFAAGFPGGGGQLFGSAKDRLWSDPARLASYDIVMFSCEGATFAEDKSQAAMDAVKGYADLGGRVFLSHWHHVWLRGEKDKPEHGIADWERVATWTNNEDELVKDSSSRIDELANPKGPSFASWMLAVGGSVERGHIALQNQAPDPMKPDDPILSSGRSTCSGVDPALAERWVYLPDQGEGTQNFQFTTPLGVAPPERCGKVVFSDMHVSGIAGEGDYPDSCGASAQLTPQEKALAFMFFDIASCVGEVL